MDGPGPAVHDPADDAQAAEVLDDSQPQAGEVHASRASKTRIPIDDLVMTESPRGDVNQAVHEFDFFSSGAPDSSVPLSPGPSSPSPHPSAVQEPLRAGRKKQGARSIMFAPEEQPLQAPQPHARQSHARQSHARAGAAASTVDVKAESAQHAGCGDRLEEAINALHARVDALEAELLKRPEREEIYAKVEDVRASCKTAVLNLSEVAEEGIVAKKTRDARGTHVTGGSAGLSVYATNYANSNRLTPRERRICEIIQGREQHRDDVQEAIRKRIAQFKRMGLSDTDGHKETDLTEEQRNTIDEDHLMKEYAKNQIFHCKNSNDLLMKAELLIEEDWLDRIEALPGNLFCLAAFGDLIPPDTEPFSLEGLRCVAKYIGCVLIVLIQLMGPPLIFLSRMPGSLGVHEEHAYHWRCHPFAGAGSLGSNSTDSVEECPSGKLPSEVHLLDDWAGLGTTKGLGIIFIITFILNSLIIVVEEKNTWRNLYNTFRFLDWKNTEFKAPGGIFLGAGAFVNCWVVVWTCLDMFVVVGASQSPQDLLLDALGLLFLYKLDDVAGDLQFVEESDWPGTRIAWIYSEVVHPWPDEEFDEDVLDKFGTVFLLMYNVAVFFLSIMLVVIPIVATITPFRDIAPDD